ncbi:hypothetical protein J2W55_002109 [Mucilaginibacter pocheonensis]|uniref:Uncharacterized protein n=1 Tax=Mucilaginibacter pocheonensis TaxID=398050 RepID=A0ABU1TA36_9SPHI|nr:hypothetical protein [Mucilaginibacter pocheonensis]
MNNKFSASTEPFVAEEPGICRALFAGSISLWVTLYRVGHTSGINIPESWIGDAACINSIIVF